MSGRQSFTIRDARPDEYDAIAALTLRAYEEYAAIMAPPAWQGLSGAVRAALKTEAPHERIVADANGAIVGSVFLFPPAWRIYGSGYDPLPWHEVRLLSVAPEARGMGVARALMEECVRRATAAGATRLGIHTSRSMRAALELYRTMGFQRAPEYDFYPPGAERVEAFTLGLTKG
jgi:predicted N-acetyltransferase YhbS